MEPAPAQPDCTPKPGRPWWRWCRCGLRWCGHGSWIAAALLLYAAVHLNQIGVPDFVKRPVLEQLRERGVELDFTRMRVRLTRGLVAENVNVSRARGSLGEVIYVGELRLGLQWRDLLSFKAPSLQVVEARDGRITLPLETGTNSAPFPFRIEHVQSLLRFDGPEAWTLEKLEADCLDGRFTAKGTVVNAPWLNRRKPSGPEPGPAQWDNVRRQLLRYARALDRMTFASPPSLDLEFHVDAAKPEQSAVTASLSAEGAESAEYGKFDRIRLSLEAHQATNDPGLMVGALQLESAAARTRWASVSSLHLNLGLEQGLTNARPRRLDARLAAESVSTRWAQLDRLELKTRSEPVMDVSGQIFDSVWEGVASGINTEWARLTNADFVLKARHDTTGPLTNWMPRHAEVDLNANGVGTRWARAGSVELKIKGQPTAAENRRELDAWWTKLEPFEFATTVVLADFSMPKLTLEAARVAVGWSNGVVKLQELTGRLYGGGVQATAEVDAASRRANATVRSDFDLHRLEPLMTTNAVRWIRQYGWRPEQPVLLQAEGSAVLPAWTNRQPDWRGEVLPTLLIAGTAQVTNFTFRGLPGDRGFVPFAHTNMVWIIRNARAWRPEGEAEFDYEGDTRNQDYHFRVRSSVDPNLVRPLLEPAGVRALGLFQFTTPPHLEGDVWGRWFARERTGFATRLSATNFTFRGEQVDEFRGTTAFTNTFVSIRDVDLKRSNTWAQVPSAGFDTATRTIYLTNAMATLDPAPVTRVIGPKTHEMMSVYKFDQPLRAVVNGVIPVGNTDEADVKFEASLGGFHWWRFNTTNTSALVHWQGDRLTVSNLDTEFHGGRLTGDIWVNTADKDDVQFGFDATGRDLNLSSLLHDLLPNTNRLDGTLNTHLVVPQASARDDGPWTGHGDVKLRDGYLWGLPLFGALSKPLEAISPGLGQQKFTEGTATFTITNRVVRSKDLELKSPAMRMKFQGEVGFDAHLDSRMEVELLRDMPVVGGLVSFVLKPFTKLLEFDVKGRLGKPEADFRYVPSFILAPLRPIQTLKALFPDDKADALEAAAKAEAEAEAEAAKKEKENSTEAEPEKK